MKISTHSWHYKVNAWAWGDVPRNLCPYVDKLVLAMVLSPVIAAWKALNDNGKRVLSIFLGTLPGAIIVFFTGGWQSSLLFEVAAFAGIGVIFGIVKFAFYLGDHGYHWPSFSGFWKWWDNLLADKPPKPHRSKPPKAPKEPSLTKQWLKAKHDRICPFIEFTDRDFNELRKVSL